MQVPTFFISYLRLCCTPTVPRLYPRETIHESYGTVPLCRATVVLLCQSLLAHGSPPPGPSNEAPVRGSTCLGTVSLDHRDHRGTGWCCSLVPWSHVKTLSCVPPLPMLPMPIWSGGDIFSRARPAEHAWSEIEPRRKVIVPGQNTDSIKMCFDGFC